MYQFIFFNVASFKWIAELTKLLIDVVYQREKSKLSKTKCSVNYSQTEQGEQSCPYRNPSDK